MDNTMARYKIDYLTPPTVKKGHRSNQRSVTTWLASIAFFVFALLFFGGLGTAFRYRGQHQTLRQQHDALRLRYDSLYAAKLEADERLIQMRRQLQSIEKKP
jgi:hypothetical protein